LIVFKEGPYLVVPGLRSSRIHILDTRADTAQPRLIKTIEPEEVARKTGYSRPHTTHCGPDGIYMNALGAADGNGPGGIFVLDPNTFEIRGAWEQDRGPQQLAYDFSTIRPAPCAVAAREPSASAGHGLAVCRRAGDAGEPFRRGVARDRPDRHRARVRHRRGGAPRRRRRRGAADCHAAVADSAHLHAAPTPASGLAATAVHSGSYLLVTAAIAWVVFHKLGVGLLRRAWINLDVIWAAALILSGALTALLPPA
jgi:hypothetical protein